MTAAVIIAVRERLERVRREQGLSLVDRLLVFGPPRNFVAGSDIRPANDHCTFLSELLPSKISRHAQVWRCRRNLRTDVTNLYCANSGACNIAYKLVSLMKFSAVLLGLLLSVAIVHPSLAVTRISDDKGGPLGEYLLRFTRIRDSGERVIIDGNCLSACTLVTIIPKERICVTQRAVLGFHAGWIDDNMGKRPTSAEGTRLLFELYPPTIRSWINSHGGLGARMILLRGRELSNLYPRCK